jgi:hypothetical protein
MNSRFIKLSPGLDVVIRNLQLDPDYIPDDGEGMPIDR